MNKIYTYIYIYIYIYYFGCARRGGLALPARPRLGGTPFMINDMSFILIDDYIIITSIIY